MRQVFEARNLASDLAGYGTASNLRLRLERSRQVGVSRCTPSCLCRSATAPVTWQNR